MTFGPVAVNNIPQNRPDTTTLLEAVENLILDFPILSTHLPRRVTPLLEPTRAHLDRNRESRSKRLQLHSKEGHLRRELTYNIR